MNIKRRQLKALRDDKTVRSGNVWHQEVLIEWDSDGSPRLEPGWYHTDETQSDCYGPFKTRKEALDALDAYCEWLNQPRHDLH